MTYGLSPRLFNEDGPVAHSARLAEQRSTARSWSILGAERRLALVQRALRPASDHGDGFPAAL